MQYQTITIRRPDDFHLHLRNGTMLTGIGDEIFPGTISWSAMGQVKRALVMPNLMNPETGLPDPVTTAGKAQSYYQDIVSYVNARDMDFEPLMTLYLHDGTTPEDIREAAASGIVKAAKLYPAHATTGSALGVTDIDALDGVFETMAEVGMVLCVHGELLHNHDGEVDIFHRESRFLFDVFEDFVNRYPTLKIVLEHITTEDAARFVLDAPDNVGATITAHHLLENRNALFRNGLNPHNFCLPILKKEKDRKWLLKVATSGNQKFFKGSDSAPHAASKKLSACGCAGCFTAPVALQLYAMAFESVGSLDKLENFVSRFGAEFYDLPLNEGTVTLVRKDFVIPAHYQFQEKGSIVHGLNDIVVPFWAERTIPWSLAG